MRTWPGEQLLSPGFAMQDINSQVAEQRNNLLERLRTQVGCTSQLLGTSFLAHSLNQHHVQIAYMGHDNVMLLLKLFLGYTNQAALQRLTSQQVRC